MAVPPFIALSLASKQFDRYGLALLAVAAITVGVVVASGARRLAEDTTQWPPAGGREPGCSGRHRRLFDGDRTVGAGLLQPGPGGRFGRREDRADRLVRGLRTAGQFIARREEGNCDAVTILAPRSHVPPAQDIFPCGVRTGTPEDATYVVIYVSVRQRTAPDELEAMTRRRELVATVEELGVTYAEIYGPRP